MSGALPALTISATLVSTWSQSMTWMSILMPGFLASKARPSSSQYFLELVAASVP